MSKTIIRAGNSTWGKEMNDWWKKQQAVKTAQQNANNETHHDVTAKEKPPVIHPDTPKPTGQTPEECRECSVSKQCKVILKMWYQHAPRPELVRGWVRLVDEHAADMVCLSKLQEPQDNRFSLREEK